MYKKAKRQNNKRGYLKKALLGLLSTVGEATFEVIDESFLNPNYAFTGFSRELLGLNNKNEFNDYRKREAKLRRNLLAVTLWRLEREGLVSRSGPRKHALWGITTAGEHRLHDFKIFQSMVNLSPEDGQIRIVSFDIPEKDRWKRDRLRELLGVCGYSLLQRSLWVGKRPLARFVFSAIKKWKLRHHVHIFEISKRGTIRGLV